jgi:hypothetical protein
MRWMTKRAATTKTNTAEFDSILDEPF